MLLYAANFAGILGSIVIIFAMTTADMYPIFSPTIVVRICFMSTLRYSYPVLIYKLLPVGFRYSYRYRCWNSYCCRYRYLARRQR
jgi:hypothetical protein